MAAAATWKILKIALCRRRRGCIYFLSAAAAQPIGLHLYLRILRAKFFIGFPQISMSSVLGSIGFMHQASTW
jgi:hypothetical protein